MRRLLALAVGVLLAVGPGAAHAEVSVEPDRPDVADSTKTVPPGAFQVEAGVSHARERVGGADAIRRSAVEVTLRAGLTDNLEARLQSEPFVQLRGGERADESGDIVLGFKWRLRDAPPDSVTPSLGLLPFVKVPTADAPVGSERVDFGLVGLASFELPRDVSVDANVGLAAIGQSRPDGFLLQAQGAVSVGYKLTDDFTVFGEIFFASREERGGRDSAGLDAGFVYLIHPRVAVDVALETSLAGRGPDYAVRAGISVLIGR